MNQTIIILSGGFDPVHIGHVRMFQAAKAFPATVIVGLNSDSWLQRKKGKPFMPWDERKVILDAMSCVDSVRDFNDDDESACDLIRQILEENKEQSSNTIDVKEKTDSLPETAPVKEKQETGINKDAIGDLEIQEPIADIESEGKEEDNLTSIRDLSEDIWSVKAAGGPKDSGKIRFAEDIEGLKGGLMARRGAKSDDRKDNKGKRKTKSGKRR